MLDRFHEWLRERPPLAGAVLALVTYIVYAGSLANDFAYDDIPQILNNPFVQSARLWPKIFTTSVWGWQGSHMHFYRPLQFCVYWLVYRCAGPAPAAFHLVQLLLYAATVWLVFRLGRELLHNEVAAFAGALLWALHPQHVETVVWVSALPDAGFAFFYLLGFLLFLRAEKAGSGQMLRHSLAALAYFPALFFKEMALSFVLVLLAYLFFCGSGAASGRRLRQALHGVPYFLAIGTYLVIRLAVLGKFSASPHLWQITPGLLRSSVALLGEHTRLFFWPTHLSAFRTFEVGPSLRSPWPWLMLATLIALLWIRKREPLLGFLVFWWPVTLLPCLDVRQVSFPVLADRFTFLPSVGLCFAISYLAFDRLYARWPNHRLAPYLLSGLALVALSWTIGIVRLIPTWRDNTVLVAYSFQQSPNAAMLHIIRAHELLYLRGDLEAAGLEYAEAMKLDRESDQPRGLAYLGYLGLGLVADRKGRSEEAVRYFERAAQLLPQRHDAYDSLGAFYFPRGEYAKAAEYFTKAVQSNPYDLIARFYLGTCWMKLGKYREAAEQFHAARAVDPDYREAYGAEAAALEAAGNPVEAAAVRRLLQGQ